MKNITSSGTTLAQEDIMRTVHIIAHIVDNATKLGKEVYQ